MVGSVSIYKVLSKERRWLALQYVQSHRTLALADLAELVAEDEEDQAVQEIAEEIVRDVYVSLYHAHVPLLEEADLVQYDQEQDLVSATDQLESTLETAAEELLELGDSMGHKTSS